MYVERLFLYSAIRTSSVYLPIYLIKYTHKNIADQIPQDFQVQLRTLLHCDNK